MITINLKNYDEFVNKVGKLVVDKSIDTGIKKTIYKLRGEVSKEQISQGINDTGLLANGYREKFSTMKGELYNFREYGLFVHEGHKQKVGRFVRAINARLVKPFVKGRPWFTDALEKNKDIAEDTISEEILKTLSKLG